MGLVRVRCKRGSVPPGMETAARSKPLISGSLCRFFGNASVKVSERCLQHLQMTWVLCSRNLSQDALPRKHQALFFALACCLLGRERRASFLRALGSFSLL